MFDFWIYSSLFPFISHHLQSFLGQEHIRSVLLQDFFDGKLVGQAYLTFLYLSFFGPTLTRGWLACFLFFVYYFIPPGCPGYTISPSFLLAYFCFIRVTAGKQYWVVLLRYPKNFAMFKE
jgi:hypothetical protein